MLALYKVPGVLRRLPARTGLAIYIPSAIFCLSLQILLVIITHSLGSGAPIIMIPVVLCAWLFKPYIAYAHIICVVIFLVLLNTIYLKSFIWPMNIEAGFIFGLLGVTVTSSCISFLHNALEVADRAEQKSRQAEKQITLAYEHEQYINTLNDQFLLNVSHELRTPLTEIKGYIDLLLEHQQQIDSEMQKTFLKHAAHGCDELQLLVNNVLETNIRDDVKSPQRQIVQISELLYRLLGYIDTKGHPLHTEITPDIAGFCDEQQLQQVMRNLLSNAFKYSPGGLPVTVRAEVVEVEECRYVRISVRDEGAGIAAEDIPLLFQKFARLPKDVNGPVRGTGLGLYMSKKFIEGMGGQIWVESEGKAGRGSRFCFTLPSVTDAVSTGNF